MRGAPFIRFYLAVPLVLEGVVVGTLCAMDGAPRPARELDPVLFTQLTNLAALVASLLGGAVQVDPIKFKLTPPGTKRLKLQCGMSLSTSAFKFNLRRYTSVLKSTRFARGARRNARATWSYVRLTTVERVRYPRLYRRRLHCCLRLRHYRRSLCFRLRRHRRYRYRLRRRCPRYRLCCRLRRRLRHTLLKKELCASAQMS